MKTFLADSTGDLVLNSSRDLDLITGPGAVAQNCRMAMKTRRGECRFDAARGVPFDSAAWGGTPNVAAFEAAGRQILANVPGVAAVVSFAARLDGETLSYQAVIRDIYGEQSTVNG